MENILTRIKRLFLSERNPSLPFLAVPPVLIISEIIHLYDDVKVKLMLRNQWTNYDCFANEIQHYVFRHYHLNS